MNPGSYTEGVTPIASTIGFPVENARPRRLPPVLPQLRVLVIATTSAPESGVGAVMSASSSVESEFFCVTRTFDLLRDIGSTPNIDTARRAALASAAGADVVMIVMHDELLRLAEQSVELGIETLADVGLPVLMLTDLADERAEDFTRAAAWFRMQVRGVIALDSTESELTAAIRAVSAGLVVIEPRVSQALQQAAVRKRPAPRVSDGNSPRAGANAPPLSAREREVLALLAEGLATKNIAHQLGISAHTVKAHVESIFAKFGATTRAEAVAIGVRRGAVLL